MSAVVLPFSSTIVSSPRPPSFEGSAGRGLAYRVVEVADDELRAPYVDNATRRALAEAVAGLRAQGTTVAP